MKIIKDGIDRKGKRLVTVELDVGETLMGIRADAYYRLGYPFDEIVRSEQITEAVPVLWCVLEQQWVE
jgi:hypothetical protein